jgi:cytochrome c oxidase accessory protein FixG
VFVLLPAFDLLRFDFTRARLHLFREEIWLDEWTLLWLFLMFAMWLIGAVSLVFGRVYCAYACPQMVFTELAHDLDALGRRLTRRLDPRRRAPAARAVSLALLALVSVAASVFLMGYFAPLDEVLRRLARFDLGPWVGAVGAIAAALAFVDFAFVRETFCRTVCPYGLLQGVIEDGRSLHVRFDEAEGACIDCGACARVCPMGIDVRDGAFQIECTRCGSCIDACDGVLARLKPARPGLLGFAFGGVAERRFDAKRVLVGVATLGFGAALVTAVALRERVSLHLSPLYAAGAASEGELAESRFLLRAANRGREPVVLDVRLDGLPAEASFLGLDDPCVPAGEERNFTLVVRVPRAQVHSSVTPFAWVVQAGERSQRFPAALFARKGKTG